MRAWWGISVAVGAALLCGSISTARADEARADAFAARAAARTAEGNRRAAIDLYEAAYAEDPRREFLRRIAWHYENLAAAGDPRDIHLAILDYERSLAGEGQTPERAAIEARLARLRGELAKAVADPAPFPADAVGPSVRPLGAPVRITAYDEGEVYQVELGGSTCTTPCTAEVRPGAARLHATGPGEVETLLEIPARPAQIRIRQPNPPIRVAGAVLIPGGALVASTMWLLAAACGNGNPDCAGAQIITWPVVGAAMFITGIVLVAVGRTPKDANRVLVVAPPAAPPPPPGIGLPSFSPGPASFAPAAARPASFAGPGLTFAF